MVEVPENILKHLIRNKSIQPSFIVVYDFETMIAETDDQPKVEELRKNKHKLSTVKTGEHIPIGFALASYYLENIQG